MGNLFNKLEQKLKIYFISDIHLGADIEKYPSDFREKLVAQWLDEVKQDASAIYLMGDIFDFWFEYKRVIPKGFTRFLGKVCEIADSGIPVYYFTGNHDIWTFGYLRDEIGLSVFHSPQIININNKKLYIAHGDALGPYDKSYNFLKKIFTNKYYQFLFRIIHPDCGIKFANSWSSSSRRRHKYPKTIIPDNEWLVKYAKTVLEKEHIDYFIFGHRHIPFQYELKNNSIFTNLGDWINNFSYAVFDGDKLKMEYYPAKLNR